MARYFLHQRGGVFDFTDEDGEDFATLEAARDRAVTGIRSILAEEMMKGHLPLEERIDIHDESGCCLLTVGFDEVFTMNDYRSGTGG